MDPPLKSSGNLDTYAAMKSNSDPDAEVLQRHSEHTKVQTMHEALNESVSASILPMDFDKIHGPRAFMLNQGRSPDHFFFKEVRCRFTTAE
jgi:hypothetical protein